MSRCIHACAARRAIKNKRYCRRRKPNKPLRNPGGGGLVVNSSLKDRIFVEKKRERKASRHDGSRAVYTKSLANLECKHVALAIDPHVTSSLLFGSLCCR